jgi:hypothetical protein
MGVFFMDSALLKADQASIACSAEKDGSLRVRYAQWEDHKVLAPSEVLHVRNVGGQVHAYREPIEPLTWPMSGQRTAMGFWKKLLTIGSCWGPSR